MDFQRFAIRKPVSMGDGTGVREDRLDRFRRELHVHSAFGLERDAPERTGAEVLRAQGLRTPKIPDGYPR